MVEFVQPPLTTKQKRTSLWAGRRLHWKQFAPLLTVLFLLVLWQLVVMMGWLPPFILPAPISVARKALEVIADGTLQGHLATTLYEMVMGLLFGVSIGTVLGYLIAKSSLLESLLSPLIVAFQATPVIAYAPLLIIWFGTGLMSKVVTCAIVVFFPMLINTMIGVRSVPQDLRDLFLSFNAGYRQIALQLELPSALPIFLAGLKTSATLALIGAVVGEFVSAKSGLGFMVNLARNQFDTPLVLVGVFTMTAVALSFYGMVTLLERRLLRWKV